MYKITNAKAKKPCIPSKRALHPIQPGMYKITNANGKEPCIASQELSRTYATLPSHLRTATRCNTLQHTATHCNTLQHTATHCNTPQHSATHCNPSLLICGKYTHTHTNTHPHTHTNTHVPPSHLRINLSFSSTSCF